MRTSEELIAELENCVTELEEVRKEEQKLIPKPSELHATADLPPVIISDELLGKINDIHDRQIAIFNKRSEILQELQELHEQKVQAIKDKRVIEGLSKAQSQTLEEVLARATQQARELFLGLHDKTLKLSEVEAVPGRWWIDYQKKGMTFMTLVTPDFKSDSLGLFIKMGNRQVNDPKGWTKKVDGPSELNTTFRVGSEEHLDYAMSLIRQAYNYTR
jgi:predicted transport protein